MKYLTTIFLTFALSQSLAAQDTLTVAPSGKADFRTIQEALNAIPSDQTTWTVVLIKPGIYKEKVVLAQGKNYVRLIGESPENTVITWNDHSGKVVNGDTISTYTSYTFSIRGSHIIIENLTIENTAGPVGQAVACETQGDCIAFYNCRLLGDQDTFYTKGSLSRVYVKGCTISGTTDYIFGPSIVLFEDCHLICKKDSYITAASTTERNAFGYVFRNCRITAIDGVSKVYLGRPWRSFAKTVFLQCEFDLPIRPEGWHHWVPERSLTAFYAEYKCFGRGADVSQRVDWSHQLTDAQAAEYTIEKIFAKNTVSEPFTRDWFPERGTPLQRMSHSRHDATNNPEPLAFPGAEGFGKYATGGRGGAVYTVTSLDDDPHNPQPGTFRYAVGRSGARTVVFSVSGTIHLKDKIAIRNGDLTIAGQSSPGDGICIAGHSVSIFCDNVIIRYMRFRMGDGGGYDGDALDSRRGRTMIIDHCSMSWSTDECASFYDMYDFTLQWCLLAESLRNSVHSKGMHGYAAIWGGQNVTFHHNLMAHHDSRNPRFASGELGPNPVDFRNNVVYNWGANSGYGGEAANINIVNNYYKPGPATRSDALSYKIFSPDKKLRDDGSNRFHNIIDVFGKFYVEGNYMYGNPFATADNWTYGIQVPPSYGATAADKAAMRATVPFPFAPITQHSAEEAYELVLERVGASLWRDSVDARVIRECRTGTYTYEGSKGSTNGLIDSHLDVGGWPLLRSFPAPLDTDGDGMPDAWEVANGLDPNVPNANGFDLSPHYTNLEVYLNSLVRQVSEP